MSATLNGADRKLFSFSDRDNMPPVALLAKNLLIHIFIDLNYSILLILAQKEPHLIS